MSMITIPYFELRGQYLSLKKEIDAAVLRVLESGRYILGEDVELFEKEFAAYQEASHGVALNSGTSALHLALLALEIGPGDEVITVPFTFVATVAAILYAGAKPVLVDIDPETLTLDVKKLEAAITSRTKAVIPVHLYGQPADLDPIIAVAKKRGLKIIEDACQAHGARYRGHRVGSIGEIGAFSFYPAKNLGACGEGGIAITKDAELAKRMRMLRDWGQEQKNTHLLKGFNSRMDGIQGAILRVKLTQLDKWTQERKRIASRYDAGLKSSPVKVFKPASYGEHVYHVYAVRTPERDVLKKFLEEKGIQTAIHYTAPVHLQPAYNGLGYKAGDLPHAEKTSCEILSLPCYPGLDEKSQDAVIRRINAFAGPQAEQNPESPGMQAGS